LTSGGYTIDFYLSPTRNIKAAKRFLSKALRRFKEWKMLSTINTDKAPTYAVAIKKLKDEGLCSPELEHRQVKYFNKIEKQYFCL
jgi:IS6 family transposase